MVLKITQYHENSEEYDSSWAWPTTIWGGAAKNNPCLRRNIPMGSFSARFIPALNGMMAQN